MTSERYAIIFDFDGLVLDTETPLLDTWQRMFQDAGGEFDVDRYLRTIGTFGTDIYFPEDHLAVLRNHSVTSEEMLDQQKQQSLSVINESSPNPGVVKLISCAKSRGIQLAIGSSSPYDWVSGHLKRLQLWDHFDTVVTFDDVGQSKPEPDIFLRVLENLQITADKALVLEDSYNGILAAHRAGIRAVAVPNPVTSGQDFSAAEEVLSSLELLDLDKYFPHCHFHR